MGITVLYTLTGISFALCAAVLIWDGKLVLGAAPNNWAEDLSLAVCIASMTGIGALSLALHQWRLAARHRQEAITDSLTGLLNRRALFDRHGERQMGSSTAVIIFDLDHFKSINDRYGHPASDVVLKQVAVALQALAHGEILVARIGGEEFAAMLPEQGVADAGAFAQRLCDSIAALDLGEQAGVRNVTVSIGVAGWNADAATVADLLRAADAELYRAKQGGRNRVCVAA